MLIGALNSLARKEKAREKYIINLELEDVLNDNHL